MNITLDQLAEAIAGKVRSAVPLSEQLWNYDARTTLTIFQGGKLAL